MFLAVAIIALVVLWLGLTIGIIWAVFGFLVLFFSLTSFFFPTEYSVDTDGIRVRRLIYFSHRPITEFKRIYILKNGVLFSPFKKKTFLDNFRGLFLLLPPDRERVIKYLKERFGELIVDDKS